MRTAILAVFLLLAACSGGGSSGGSDKSSQFTGLWAGDMKSAQWHSGFRVDFETGRGAIGNDTYDVHVDGNTFQMGQYTFEHTAKMHGTYMKGSNPGGHWNAWKVANGIMWDPETGEAQVVEVQLR